MSNATIAYPFDPTGVRASNKITAEHLTIAPPELSEFLFLIPAAAPFFKDSMEVVHLPSNRTLVEGVDYVVSHYFHDASLACAKPIYGSLTFTDNRMTGAVRLNYQTLGGDWTLETAKIIQILSNKLVNPRRVTWEQIADLPYAFPPVDHDWHLDDMVGMSELVAVVEGIRDALIASGEGGLQAHIADKENPHAVTKAQVGLGSVANYGVATVAEAQAGTTNTKYLTVLRGAQMIEALIGNTLTTHIGRSDNPHNVTKAQIGLSNVQDYAVASQSEAEAGSASNRYMTPLRTAQAIQNLVNVPLNSHISNTNNPHGVTAAQVGLGLVQNYGIADAVAARAGLSNELYMTPAMTREAINTIALQGVTDHLDDRSNPHQVTKDQVGLGFVQNYPVASQPEAEAGASNLHYLTVLRGRQLLEAVIGTTLTDHLNDSANPHGVTKAQVGLSNVDNYGTASDEQAALGAARNLFMTPAGTAAAITALSGAALTAHIDDNTNPHGVTKGQVGLGNVDNFATATTEIAEAGSSTTHFMTPASTVALINALGGAGGGSSAELQAHLNDLGNPHEVTAEQVGLGLVQNYGVATTLQAEEGTATNVYMTPATTAEAIAALIGTAFDNHVTAINPHNVTASQVGAYSATETDALLMNKLDSSAQAQDSLRLAGHTYEEVIASARTIEQYPVSSVFAPVIWTLLGEVTLPGGVGAAQVPDIIGIVTGGEAASSTFASSFTVHLSPRDLERSRVVVNNENYSRDVKFGYTAETQPDESVIVRLYQQGPLARAAITVATVSAGEKFFINTDTVLDAEPADITYLSINLPPFTRQLTSFGDVSFGKLPNTQNSEQVTGGLVEWISVAHNDAEELEVRAVETSLEAEYGEFLPASPGGFEPLYTDLMVLDKWGWNATDEGILLDTDTVPGNATLTANEYMTDYTFEVEIGSTDAAAMGAGVLAAVVEVDGRQHSIAVVRTPGGLNNEAGFGGFEYKLSTAALNIGQADYFDLGSSNGTLKWGDNATAEDERDPAVFDPDLGGWDTAGKVRIRVVRAGNTLTIDVSQFNETAYVVAEQLVLDFDTQPRLAVFKDRPSTWGLISIKQPYVTFKVLARPRQYLDYVRIGVPADNGKQRHYRFDGLVWQMSYLGISNPLVRPNRLYYSDWNGRLYQSQRNGRLRELQIEAFSRANPTVLTT